MDPNCPFIVVKPPVKKERISDVILEGKDAKLKRPSEKDYLKLVD